jgi:hydroxymethylpyrimidine kinase/phosphomethylpyrimidine kinase
VADALWVLGGLDPSGGAGVLRDVATARAVAPTRVVHVGVTAFTQQGDGQPADAQATSAEALRFQLARAPKPAAVKLGLLPAAVVSVIVEALAPLEVPVVLDPVLQASAGGSMGARAEALLPLLRGAVVTPNRREYDVLVGADEPRGWLARHGVAGLLRKGGHDDGNSVTDTLWTGDGSEALSRPRQSGPDPRGTGCALATAIACVLASGVAVTDAVKHAVTWLDAVRGRARSVGGQWLLP